MANEEKRRVLLALAPILLQPPPTIQAAQLLYPEPETADAAGLIGAAAFAVMDAAEPRQPPRPQQGGYRITTKYLQEIPETEALWMFRCVPVVFRFRFQLIGWNSSMRSQDLLQLVEILHLPGEIVTHAGHRFNRVEAFALTCARLASAGDEFDLSARYDRSQSAISQVFNEVILFLDHKWGHLLQFDFSHLLSPTNLERYATAIFNSGSPMRHVWGFIDCTARPMCRPSRHQRQAYNGHKHFHGLKYQAIMLPNGLFGHLYGPIEGRHNDAFVLDESGIMDECIRHTKLPGGGDEAADEFDTSREVRYFQLFGDPAYGLNEQIISPYPKAGRTDEQQKWNTQMSKVRIEVEHGFAVVTNNWKFLQARWKLRLFQSPIGSYYRVAVLLTNALACIQPNQVAKFFNCHPPSLEDYFHN